MCFELVRNKNWKSYGIEFNEIKMEGKEYKSRVIDSEIELYQKTIGARLIEESRGHRATVNTLEKIGLVDAYQRNKETKPRRRSIFTENQARDFLSTTASLHRNESWIIRFLTQNTG